MIGSVVMESFFHTLKVEWVEGRNYATMREVAEDLNWWVGTWYNQERLHSSIGYLTPLEYERSKKCAKLDVGIPGQDHEDNLRESR